MMGTKLLEDKLLIQDRLYSEMYRVKWPDREVSDIVNKTRAKEVIRIYIENRPRTDSRMPGRSPEKPTGAFK